MEYKKKEIAKNKNTRKYREVKSKISAVRRSLLFCVRQYSDFSSICLDANFQQYTGTCKWFRFVQLLYNIQLDVNLLSGNDKWHTVWG